MEYFAPSPSTSYVNLMTREIESVNVPRGNKQYVCKWNSYFDLLRTK